MPSPTLTQTIGEFSAAIALHYGPGPHPDGSPQRVHGGGQMAFDLDAAGTLPEPAADAGQDWAHDKITWTYGPENASGAQTKRLTALLHERLPQATWADVRAAYEFDDRGPDGSGLYSEVYAIDNSAGGVMVQGKIYDSAADAGTHPTKRRAVGTFVRTIHEDIVEHGELMLEGAAQGRGFGSRFYANSEAAYRRMGVTGVMLYANSTVGGYAWARAGFDWADADKEGGYFIHLAAEKWRDHSRFYDRRPPMPKIEHAWELAALTHPDGTRIGKEVLLGEAWSAIKDLTAGSPGLRVGDAYYAAKAQKGRP